MKLSHFVTEAMHEHPIDELAGKLETAEGVLWLDIAGVDHDASMIMSDTFGFHELAIEDTRNQNQRPKAEEYSDHLFIILNPINHGGDEQFRELDVFVGKNYVVTAHPEVEPTLELVRKRLAQFHPHTPIAPSYLLYTIMDVIVDSYFPILENIETEIEEIEQRILEQPDQEMLNRLFQLRRILNEFWRVIRPQRDIINVLMNHEYVFITENHQYYLRDVSDHLMHITDMTANGRETLTNLVNLYLTVGSNRINQVVTRLTIFTIIVGTLAVVSGFYGMNFEHTFPAFDQQWGVPIVLAIMALIVGGFLVVFRWEKWL
jgi:magnesium transporter